MGRSVAQKKISSAHAQSPCPPALDVRAGEGLDNIVTVYAQCGYSPEDIERRVQKACRSVPKSWQRRARQAQADHEAFGRMLTLWYSNPQYLDDKGFPRSLPLRGRLSLESLAFRAGFRAKLRTLLRYPLSSGALLKQGKQYLPRDRVLHLRGPEGLHHPQSLRGLWGLLETLAHNRARAPGTPVRLQLFTVNEEFPVRARAGFENKVATTCTHLAHRLDAEMVQPRFASKKGEPTLIMGVGIYVWEETPGKDPEAI